MQRGRLLIILGIILGVATLAVVAFLLLQGGGGLVSAPPTPTPAPPAEETGIPTTEVIVALQPISRGSPFVAGSIGRRPWPAANVPPDVIADEAETIGKVAKTEIVQGQIIVRSMLADLAGAGEASFLIPLGRVAVAYPINRQTSVAYAIQPGDYVDILITAFFLDIDQEFQSTLPNKLSFIVPELDENNEPTGRFTLSEPIDEGRFEVVSDNPAVIFPREAQIPRRVAQLTVQGAKVIKVGPWIEPPPPPTPEGQPEGAPTPTPPLPDVVTLAVTPQDALVLLWLRQSGIYSEMALRSAGEENADHLTEAVTLQYMLTRFNIAVPPKIEFVMAPSIKELEQQQPVVVEGTTTEGQR
ncbi:MAG: Flp pilus assembly protein CpaB [Chloroflexi bacterium]|nr:MAG: Flp pilus assembly protein CpaB [Chloroflexota bacterium]